MRLSKKKIIRKVSWIEMKKLKSLTKGSRNVRTQRLLILLNVSFFSFFIQTSKLNWNMRANFVILSIVYVKINSFKYTLRIFFYFLFKPFPLPTHKFHSAELFPIVKTTFSAILYNNNSPPKLIKLEIPNLDLAS